MSRFKLTVCLAVTTAYLSAGCTGIPVPEEIAANEKFDELSRIYLRSNSELPKLSSESTLEDYLSYAVRRSPSVLAAYFDWKSAVQQITIERSLPDPKLTFEADIQNEVMAVMPGLMIELPGPGKRGAQAAVAAGEAEVKSAEFKRAVLKTAVAVKQTYYELQALEGTIAANKRNLELVRELQQIASAQHASGQASLQDVLRADIEEDELRTLLETLGDSESLAATNFRSALGLLPQQSEVPLPKVFVNTKDAPDLDEIYMRARSQNPAIAVMESEIRKAEAAVRVARLKATPDFGVGIESDIKPSKPIVTPQLSMSLPIWRDKIKAEIESALAMKSAAEARLSQEQLNLAVEFASMAFMYRESDRMYRLYSERLIKKAENSVEVARSGYVGGQSSFIDFLEAERSLLQFQLARVEARKNREIALANLSLAIAGTSPQLMETKSKDKD